MSRTFSDAIAESREAFFSLARGAAATFFEVYYGTPDSGLEGLFDAALPDELLLRFDMRAHSEEARDRFCRANEFERQIYKLPDGATVKPLPYFRAYVPPLGFIDTAWTEDEVRKLIARTREDKSVARQVPGYAARQRVVE